MRDAGEFSREDLLRSWKEIASYLGVEARTCHRWESDRGMPVHRSERNGKKSPVFAYKSELDAWFKETFKSSGEQHETRPARRTLFRVAVGAAILAAAGGLSYLLFHPPGQPADFHIEGSVFVALDSHGKELWRFDTKADDLMPESFYRNHFQAKNGPYGLPVLVIKDIDADGDTEVLFALKRKSDGKGEGILFCLDRSGHKRWEYVCQRELRSPIKIFPADYRIFGVVCRDIDGDGRKEIFVLSFHAPDWPCQLAALDAEGRSIGEFWNSGQLVDIVFHDLDGDGREEMIAGGVNNEYRGGCLVVFDPRHIAGGSPQSGDFVLGGIGPGSMLYYVTTPYTDVDAAYNRAVITLPSVAVTKNDWIEALCEDGLFYDFDFNLGCAQVYPGHPFIMDHEAARRAGTVTSVLDESYWKMLKNGIRWWDGRAWSAEPTPVKR